MGSLHDAAAGGASTQQPPVGANVDEQDLAGGRACINAHSCTMSLGGTSVIVGGKSQAADAGRSGPQDIFGIPAGAIGAFSGPLTSTTGTDWDWAGL